MYFESHAETPASAKRFSEIARQAGADVLLSNHTDWDRSKINLPLVAKRTPGSPNPFVTNNDSVRRYIKVAEECATARLLRLPEGTVESRLFLARKGLGEDLRCLSNSR